MNFDLQVLSSFSGWEQLAQTGMSFGTNLLAALAIFFIGRWIATRLVTLMKAALTRAKVDKTLVSFLGNVANIGLLILVRTGQTRHSDHFRDRLDRWRRLGRGFVFERPTVQLRRRRADYPVPPV